MVIAAETELGKNQDCSFYTPNSSWFGWLFAATQGTEGRKILSWLAAEERRLGGWYLRPETHGEKFFCAKPPPPRWIGEAPGVERRPKLVPERARTMLVPQMRLPQAAILKVGPLSLSSEYEVRDCAESPTHEKGRYRKTRD